MSVPRLTTALARPLLDLERRLLASRPETERWLRGKWQERAAPCSLPNPGDPSCPPNRFYAYGVIARLALLAAATELEQAEEAALEGVAVLSAA